MVLYIFLYISHPHPHLNLEFSTLIFTEFIFNLHHHQMNRHFIFYHTYFIQTKQVVDMILYLNQHNFIYSKITHYVILEKRIIITFIVNYVSFMPNCSFNFHRYLHFNMELKKYLKYYCYSVIPL